MSWRWNASRSDIGLSTPKPDTISPGKASTVERGTNHGQTLLARPEVVPRDNEAGNRNTKEVPTLRIAPVKCSNRGGIPQGHEGYQADYLEAIITVCSGMQFCITLQGKSQTLRLRVPEIITSKCLSRSTMIPPIGCWTYMPVQSTAYFSRQNR